MTLDGPVVNTRGALIGETPADDGSAGLCRPSPASREDDKVDSGVDLGGGDIEFLDPPNAFRFAVMRPGHECSADFRSVPA